MNLFKLVGSVFIDTQAAEQSLQKVDEKAGSTGNKLSAVGDAFKKAGSKVENVGKALAPVSGAVAAVGTALFVSAKKTADYADNVDKMSQKMGLSRKTFQEMDYVLSQSGTSIESFQGGMKTLLANMDKVGEGNKTAIANFGKLGVAVTDSSGKMRSQEDVMKDTIRALQNMEDGAEKNRLANEIFGKSGQELIPLLNAEGGTIDELTEKANELGLVMGDDAVDAGVEFTDTMDTFKRTLATLGTTIGTEVMPYITDFLQKLTDNLPKVREFIQGLADKFNAIPEPIKKIIGVVALVLAAASPVLIVVGKIIGIIGTIISAVGALGPVLTVLTGPIGLVIAAIAATIAIGVALYKNWDKIKAGAKALKAQVFDALTTKFNDFKAKFNSLKEAIARGAENIRKSFAEKFGQAKAKVQPLIDILKTAKSKFDAFKEAVTHPIKFLSGLKLPTISYSEKTILGKTFKLPSGITWHDKATDNPYLLDRATIFGRSGSQLLGGGETESEIIYGRKNLMKDISEASGSATIASLYTLVSDLFKYMQSYFPSMAAGLQIDGDTLALKMNDKLGQLERFDRRG